MIRFATFGTHKMAQSHMLDAQNRLFETQMQISSGKVSRSYAGVAIDSRRLVNLENAVTGVQGYIKNIDVTESRLQLMENAVVGAFDVASRFRDLLVNALNIDNASLLTLRQRAEDMLQELAGTLNVKQNNRFLFSGSRIDSAPIDMSVLLATTLPLVDAAEFTGAATASGTGITGLTGISRVRDVDRAVAGGHVLEEIVEPDLGVGIRDGRVVQAGGDVNAEGDGRAGGGVGQGHGTRRRVGAQVDPGRDEVAVARTQRQRRVGGGARGLERVIV